MKIIHRTYKFQLLPNREQEVLLNKHFGSIRFVYNYFLNERKEQYQADKKTDNYYGQAKTLTELKKKEETIWLKEINSQTLQFALRSLDTAYVNFFRGNAQFPKFKSKRKKNTFTVPQHTKVIDNKIYLPKFKDGIRVNIHRKIKGEIGKFTISKTPTGKYFVSILTEQEYKPSKKTNKSVGIDLGLKDFAITSDGIKYKNNRYTKKYEKQLKKAQQHLSRKQKGSNGFEKQKLKVAKIHEKISNTRQDVLHKMSKEIVSNYDIICLEDLNVKGMMTKAKPKKDENGKYLPNGRKAKAGLSRSIADVSWSTFVRFVEYKANWNDKTVVKINRFYPSSKTCNVCGYINQDLNLSIRKWTCPKCSTELDRDENASANILKEGLKIYRQELSITKVEEKLDVSNNAHPVKPEAHTSLVCG